MVDIEVEYSTTGQIVSIKPKYGKGYQTIWKAYVGQAVIVSGPGFPPGKLVHITICEKNSLWAKDYVNDCGAFSIGNQQEPRERLLIIPDSVTTNATVSVKAWIDENNNQIFEENELQADWPLYLYKAQSIK